MKKVLFLIHDLNIGGAQRVLVDMVNKLDLDNYDITIQTIFDRDELRKELNERIHYKSIIRTKNRLLIRIYAYLIRRVLNLKLVYNIFIKDDYDYEVGYLEGEPTRLIANSTNKKSKKIAWVHTDMMLNFGSQGLYKTLDEHREMYKKFDKIVCVSQGVKKAFEERFGLYDNVCVKYNVANEKTILEKARENVADFVEGDILKLVMVSNLRPEKRHLLLLKVLKRLKDENYKFILHIVGDGIERENIEKKIKQESLCDCVKLVGKKDNPYPYMANSDLLVISSSAEGYGMVAVESCIVGTPVLSTSCAGTTEALVEGKYGIIVPNSEDGLYNGLKAILDDTSILEYYKKVLSEEYLSFANERVRELRLFFEE